MAQNKLNKELKNLRADPIPQVRPACERAGAGASSVRRAGVSEGATPHRTARTFPWAAIPCVFRACPRVLSRFAMAQSRSLVARCWRAVPARVHHALPAG
jgi:hypothetical protein